MNGEAFAIFNPRSFVGMIFSDYGCLNTEKSVLLTDSDVQTFLEDNVRKEKPIVTYSVALIMAFFTADNENRQLEDF